MIYSLNEVLIVAKCIVNYEDCNGGIDWYEVLIVAKCIVNRDDFCEDALCV